VETPAVNVGVLFCFVLRVLQEPSRQATGISPRCFLRIHHIEKMKKAACHPEPVEGCERRFGDVHR